MPLERFVLNVKAKARREKLEGRDYLVMPTVMLTEGVHEGSDGPILYLREELSKTPVVWNHKPLVAYHPEMNGKSVSACSPVIMESRKLGLILNSDFSDRLHSESWFEEEKTKKVDSRIYDALDKGEMIEVSTGVFVDKEAKSGVWNGKKYNAIARNLRPDHLAILPDRIGACSIKDGCGCGVRNEAGSGTDEDHITNRYLSKEQRDKIPPEDFGDPTRKAFPVQTQEDLDNAGKLLAHAQDPEAVKRRLTSIAKRKNLRLPESWTTPTKNEQGYWEGVQTLYLGNLSEEKHDILVTDAKGETQLITNAMSHRDIAVGINKAMKEKNGNLLGYWPGYVEDVYDEFFVYQEANKLQKQNYAVTPEHDVHLVGDPSAVVRHTEYRTTDGKHVAVKDVHQRPTYNQGDPEMATDVTNGGQKNPPANPQGGQGNQTGQGNQGNPPTNPPANPPANSTGQGTGTTSTQTPPPPNPTPAQNTQTPPQQPQPMTLEEWITKNAPPGPLQEVLRNGVASFLQERTQLITTIMNSRANSFSKEWLEHQDRKIEELRNLAKMAAAADPQQAQLQTNQQQLFNLFTPGPSYAGALNLPPTGNQTPQEDKEVPTLPVWNFRTESPAKTG